MRIAIQTQPVHRSISTAAKVSHGITASGNCGKGQWCCQGPTGGPFCVDCACTVPILGNCCSPAVADCALHLAIPSNGC